MPNRLIDGLDHPIKREHLWRLVFLNALVLVFTIWFVHVGENRWLNVASTFSVALPFTVGWLVIVSFTPDWKWRIAGLAIAISGAGFGYALLFFNFLEFTEINTLWVRSYIRASLVVGGWTLFFGILGWLWWRRLGAREPLLDGMKESAED